MYTDIKELILVNSLFARRVQHILMLFIVLFIPIMSFGFAYYFFLRDAESNNIWADFIRFQVSFWQGKNGEMLLDNIILYLVFTLYFIYAELAWRYERLELSKSGIRYFSPLPGFLKFLRSDWKIDWHQIDKLCLELPASNVKMTRLVLGSGRQQKNIILQYWVDPTEANCKKLFNRDHLDKAFLRDSSVIDKHKVIKFIRQYVGIEIEDKRKSIPLSYPLEHNPYSLATVIAFFLFLFYALIDFVVIEAAYINPAIYAVHIVIGCIATFFLYRMLTKNKVPKAESIFVSLFTSTALACALYPGMLRINQITDLNKAQKYHYQMISHSSFEPLDPLAPKLELFRYNDYWSSFEIGSFHEFQLQRGLLGFWQINLKPINDTVELFYKNHQLI